MKPPGEVVALVMLTCFFLAFVPAEGQPCQSIYSSGFKGCECNILGACNVDGNVNQDNNPTLDGYAPSGIEQFAYIKPGGPNLAYLCEGGTVAILYDCNARIPLYAATVMTAAQLTYAALYQPQKKDPQASWNLKTVYQQNGNDYILSDQRNPCYESQAQLGRTKPIWDMDWYKAVTGLTTPPPNSDPCTVQTSVHKGQLIAPRYGAGNTTRVRATFTYTNVVPQFEAFYSGSWNEAEEKVVVWAEGNCAKHVGQPTQNARIYVVVGAIPSTHGSLNPRFFGWSGFSDYQSQSNPGGEKYRVNVPRYMWTALCCTYQFRANGQLQNGVRSVAFYRENEPRREKVQMATLFPPGVDIFPDNADCNN